MKPAPTQAASGAAEDQGFALNERPAASGARATGRAPGMLGGYRVIKELERDGMGTVYLARQLSLGRNVALKVMRPEWTGRPMFVARFLREAYAAAQLVHPNIVQIHDFGEDQGSYYVSTEYVPGRTLADLLRTERAIDPALAAGYILQAARGLKFAHDQGLFHRDIKPENLWLNDQGVVKVANLGLLNTPELIEVESARLADAPEQGLGSADVDARADLDSLGRALEHLVTGDPPFEGETDIERITKHPIEAVAPPESIVSRVPASLFELIRKMIANRAEDRFASLGEVIDALEAFLGVTSAGPILSRKEQADLLAVCVAAFRASPAARLRGQIFKGAVLVWALLILLSVLARQPLLASGLIGLGLLTALASFVIEGLARRNDLFVKVRELVGGASRDEWLIGLAGTALFATSLILFHLLAASIAFSLLALALALTFHVVIGRQVEAERRGPIYKAEQLLKGMRLRGWSEPMLQQFVARLAGPSWEEFFEALFGYEAKLATRENEIDRWRGRFGAWRDPVIRWINTRQRARREVREKAVLQRVEEKSLEAQGVNLVTARRKAQRAAEAMVTIASEFEARAPAAAPASGTSLAIHLAIARALRQAAENPESLLVDRERGLLRPPSAHPLSLVFGKKPRFLVGTALLAGCLLWMDQNKVISSHQIKEAAVKAVETSDVRALRAVKINEPRRTRPLRLSILPRPVSRLFQDFNPGVAGLILAVSSLFRGLKVGLFTIAGAAIALLGPSGVLPFFGPLTASTSMGLGVTVALLALIVPGRRPRRSL